MNKFLLILGLTIIYYIVIFTWDKRRKAAFKKAQQQVIGETTTMSVISENTPAPILDTDSIFGSNSIKTASSIEVDSVGTDSVGESDFNTVTSNFKNSHAAESTAYSLEQTIAADSENMLQENLEEMLIDLEAEQTLVVPKEHSLGALANADAETMDGKALTKMIKTISNKNI